MTSTHPKQLIDDTLNCSVTSLQTIAKMICHVNVTFQSHKNNATSACFTYRSHPASLLFHNFMSQTSFEPFSFPQALFPNLNPSSMMQNCDVVLPHLQSKHNISNLVTNILSNDLPNISSIHLMSHHSRISNHLRVRNRRKHYLEIHPEYFGASLELAGM